MAEYLASSQLPLPSSIADAWVEGETLFVLSPGFDRLRVPLNDLYRVVGATIDNIKAFEIDEDGSYLYWPHANVHLGWEQLQGILDATTLLSARPRSAAFNQQYGRAIRTLREEHGLKQSEIVGIADRHLRRIEHGQTAATRSVLASLTQAHGMDLPRSLAELAGRL